MYDAGKHDVFTRRMINWMQQLWTLREEAQRLDAVYTEESASGSDAAFVDTGYVTKQELINAIVFQRTFNAMIDGSQAVTQTDRTSNITPFLATG